MGQTIDATPLFKGLPDDRCSCPHWGYVFKGKITYRSADHDEVFEAGDAFYVPEGQTPVVEAGTEFVQFQPEQRTADRQRRDDEERRSSGHPIAVRIYMPIA